MDFKQYDFIYNASAHFAGAEKYPDGLVPELIKPDKAGFEAACWALAEMATQGELIRRDMGHDRRDAPTAEHFRRHLMPHEYPAVRQLIFERINRGLHGDVDDGAEVDEVLEELGKKTDGD